jgi:hypothetical protein
MDKRYFDNLTVFNDLKMLQQSAGFEHDKRLDRLISNVALSGDVEACILVKERLERFIIRRMKDRSGLPVPQQDQIA